eukprot:6194097-Pleurochrysis_carterae.AAC.1
MKWFECLLRPSLHAVDGSHSCASSERLVARGGGSTNLSASSKLEVSMEIAAGTILVFKITAQVEGSRQQCKQEKAKKTESRVQPSRKPSRRKRSSSASSEQRHMTI